MLIAEAARLALYSLRVKSLQKSETKTARGARARALRSRQLVQGLTKHIDRVPTPDYPGGAELVRARERAKRTLADWENRYLRPLSRYENGLVVAPILRPRGAKKLWLETAAQVAAYRRDHSGQKPAAASRYAAERLIDYWRHLKATQDELRVLLRANKHTDLTRSSQELADEFLTERIDKALARHDKQKNSRSR